MDITLKDVCIVSVVVEVQRGSQPFHYVFPLFPMPDGTLVTGDRSEVVFNRSSMECLHYMLQKAADECLVLHKDVSGLIECVNKYAKQSRQKGALIIRQTFLEHLEKQKSVCVFLTGNTLGQQSLMEMFPGENCVLVNDTVTTNLEECLDRIIFDEKIQNNPAMVVNHVFTNKTVLLLPNMQNTNIDASYLQRYVLVNKTWAAQEKNCIQILVSLSGSCGIPRASLSGNMATLQVKQIADWSLQNYSEKVKSFLYLDMYRALEAMMSCYTGLLRTDFAGRENGLSYLADYLRLMMPEYYPEECKRVLQSYQKLFLKTRFYSTSGNHHVLTKGFLRLPGVNINIAKALNRDYWDACGENHAVNPKHYSFKDLVRYETLAPPTTNEIGYYAYWLDIQMWQWLPRILPTKVPLGINYELPDTGPADSTFQSLCVLNVASSGLAKDYDDGLKLSQEKLLPFGGLAMHKVFSICYDRLLRFKHSRQWGVNTGLAHHIIKYMLMHLNPLQVQDQLVHRLMFNSRKLCQVTIKPLLKLELLYNENYVMLPHMSHNLLKFSGEMVQEFTAKSLLAKLFRDKEDPSELIFKQMSNF